MRPRLGGVDGENCIWTGLSRYLTSIRAGLAARAGRKLETSSEGS